MLRLTWSMFCLACFAFAASGMMPMAPELAKQLRARGEYDRVVEQLRAAHDRGDFDIKETPALPSGRDKRVTNWRAIVILVDFPDYPATGSYNAASFHSMLFSQATYPTGSMRDFYLENSYGDFVLSGDVVGWYTMPQNYSYYSNFDGVPSEDDFGRGAYPHNSQKLYEDAIAAADPFVDFSLYLNGSVNVLGVFVVHAGPGAEATGNPNHIWSHAASFLASTQDGVVCASYSMEPELYAGSLSTMGVYGHEFGHTLGLPDLYDTDSSSVGIGNWSMMSYGSWNNAGRTPSHFDAWCKLRLGFVDPVDLTENSVGLTLPSAQASASSIRLKTSAHAAGEYLLLENRRKLGFDTYLPSEGLLVWHIDVSVSGNANESCGANPTHPRVRLIQADDLCDLESGMDYGDSGDPFPGSSAKTSLSTLTTPNSRAYSGKKSGVKLTNIAVASGDVVLDIQLDEALVYTVPTQFAAFSDAASIAGPGDEVRIRSDHVVTGSHILGTPFTISGGWDSSYVTQDPQAKSQLQGSASTPVLRIIGSPVGTHRLVNLQLSDGGGFQLFTPESQWQGGAIWMQNGSLEVVDCEFTDNRAGENGTIPSRGGALALHNVAADIQGCAFFGNLAKEGAEFFVNAGSLVLRDCLLGGGLLYAPPVTQTQLGGAIHAVSGAQVTLEDCEVSAYDGADKGGAIYALSSALTLTRTTLSGSNADAEGGAVYVENGTLSAESSSILQCSSSSLGGGIYATGSVVQWDRGRIGGNSSSSLGGGAYLVNAAGGSRLRSVRIDGNSSAIIGGGLIVSGGGPSIEHCVLHANSSGVGTAGAAQILNSTTVFRHNIVHASVGGGIYWSGGGSNSHNLYWGTAPGVDFSGAAIGIGSLFQDPLFLDTANGDFHLGGGSPAIDAGDLNLTLDFDGSQPDLGIYGGALDDADRPAVAASLSVTPQAGSSLLSWTFPSLGTPPLETRVYGAMETGLPKYGLGNEFLLGVVTYPTSTWSDSQGNSEFEVQLVDADGRAGAYRHAIGPVDAPEFPAKFHVAEAVPNPFNPRTTIELALPTRTAVSAEIFDARGRRVRRLLTATLEAGIQRLEWDGRDDFGAPSSSGSYFLHIQTSSGDATRRLLLMK